MIIKEIIISNYQCYFGDKNIFELSKGSNIILGKNGGGKTKFFECLEWLFDPSRRDIDELISKKKLAETQEGETFRVGIEIIFQQEDTLNIVKKYFSVQKGANKEFVTTNVVYEGIIENERGERDNMDGQSLLNAIFPATNRKYCMFKGESELNILKNEDSLVQLIALYSKVKHYKPYSDKGTLFKQYADKAVEDAVKKDNKNEKRYKEIEAEIADLQRRINEKEIFLQEKSKEQRRLEESIQGVEKHLENAESLETIKKRIAEIDDRKRKLENVIDEDYTTALFDKNWLLIHFENIQQEFSDKIKNLSEIRRMQQREYDREAGIREGENRVKATLFKNVVPLPTDTPSRTLMEEMLKDEICKVCNREAKVDSDAYNFMMQRLNDYIMTQKPADQPQEEQEELFKYNYTSKLVSLESSIDNNLVFVRSINQNIKDLLEFNRDRKEDIAELINKREKETADFEDIIGSSELGQDSLADAYKNYKGWQRDLTAVDKKIEDFGIDLTDLRKKMAVKKEEKENIDTKSANTYLTQTRKVLRDIEKIFIDTKESKYDAFVSQLQETANTYLKLINKGSFTGYIEIKRRFFNQNETIEINLMQDGEIFYHPNTSLQTSMHLAILFAISQMTKIEKEQCYPMIFDAPTSSFDPVKRKHFFDVLGDCNEQIILLTKDFTEAPAQDSGLVFSEDFIHIKRDKAILIKLEEPFDNEVLSTINTQVINL